MEIPAGCDRTRPADQIRQKKGLPCGEPYFFGGLCAVKVTL